MPPPRDHREGGVGGGREHAEWPGRARLDAATRAAPRREWESYDEYDDDDDDDDNFNGMWDGGGGGGGQPHALDAGKRTGGYEYDSPYLESLDIYEDNTEIPFALQYGAAGGVGGYAAQEHAKQSLVQGLGPIQQIPP